ncbi:hypothetical protein MNBD_BACTEROID01-1721 [hydrothermal vent metagenome]|uniref:Tetrahaem cytochrome domain-containing protein n=1 Tax=hydrothermal vent metagenome TaxID=652676 RepID=A0A3B0UVB2_9ZZZZ
MSFFIRSFICSIFILLFTLSSIPQNIPKENRHCIKCHSSQVYTIYNKWTERGERRLMNPFYILDTVRLSAGVHKDFQCIDCHSPDYETYPHNSELKLEPKSTCLDCHGGDDTYASFQFERIKKEFEKSIHFKISGESFTCSKCHSQHYYKVTARTSGNIREIVDFDNAMCLSCHNNMTKYQLVSSHENPQLVEVHNWLPNQALHFKHVRCIECHTEVADSLMVSHNILPKEKAMKKCAECHSANSLLQASLYKYQNIQSRTEKGAIKNIISNKSYVIGENQIPLLNWLSILIFIATLGGIIVHIIFRILIK